MKSFHRRSNPKMYVVPFVITAAWLGMVRPVSAGSWHVAANAGADGDGSAAKPFALQTALDGAPDRMGKPRIQPGDNIWVHGGTYRGGFISRLRGTADKTIAVRQAPGEHAIIDCKPRDDKDNGLFLVEGEWTTFWGLEFTCSDPKRETAIKGSSPKDIRRGSIECRGSHNRFINLLVHDLAGGFGFWGQDNRGEGGEIYGCLVYNNGWRGPDRGHGHAIYAQNAKGTKRLMDNILFNQFSHGIHCYGSSRASLKGFHIEGNVSFNNGCLAGPKERAPAMLIGGGSAVERLAVVGNFTYQSATRCGYSHKVVNQDAILRDNYFVGSLSIRNFRQVHASGNTIIGPEVLLALEGVPQLDTSVHVWDKNHYYRTSDRGSPFRVTSGKEGRSLDWDAWRKTIGGEGQGTFAGRKPEGVRIFIRPNRYEPGRAHIIVYNWDRKESVEASLGDLLRSGQSYRIVSAVNFHAAPVARGVYDGKPIRLPMRPNKPAQPVGMVDYRLPTTEPEFAVFVVLPGK